MGLSLYSGLPSTEHVFSIDVVGEQTGVRYAGQFTYKRPTIQMRSEIARSAAKLNGEYFKGLDDDIKSMHQIIAWLEHCLIDSPKWWSESKCGKELYDNNVISELSAKIMEFEDQWRAQISAKTTSPIP